MTQTVSTDIHRVSPTQFVKAVARAKASVLTSIIAAVVVLSIVAGYTVNTAFFLAGPAILLVIMPAVISIIYFYYALSPEAAMLTLPHRVVFSNDKIDIDFFKQDDSDTGLTLKITETYKLCDIVTRVLATEIIISKIGRDNIVAIVPFESFTSQQNLLSALSLLNIEPIVNQSL